MLKDEQLLAWWRLAHIDGLGLMALNAVRSQLDDSRQLHKCSADDLVRFGLSAEAAQAWAQDSSLSHGFDRLRAWCNQKGCGVLLAGVAPYPTTLSSLPDAPIILYYQGNLECLKQPCVAMVGSRNATPYALEWAQQAASELAAQGLTVVSGLALGIDGAAHQGAIHTGSTIAVLGSGVDVIYPQRHLGLAQMLVKKGLLLSEFELGTAPLPPHFPSRNRIVSGLSLGTVVVEAALKSGSLITAKLAAEQGREVFALPGAVTNPLSHGCHQLIRDGAMLVESSQDVLQGLQIETMTPPAQSALFASASNDAPALLSYIDYTTTATDAIALRSKLGIAQLLPQLLDLELQGFLQQVPGGYRRLK